MVVILVQLRKQTQSLFERFSKLEKKREAWPFLLSTTRSNTTYPLECLDFVALVLLLLVLR